MVRLMSSSSLIDTRPARRYAQVMHRSQRRVQFLISWGLVFIWLSLSGAALLEQLTTMPDTTAQDEQALVNLASGIKPGTPSLDDCAPLVHVGVAVASFGLSLRTSSSHHTTVLSPPPPSPLPLYQLFSVYRV
jgi:hypothetical protein